jgi:hypothetical protein
VREHCLDLGDLRRWHRSFVAELIQARQVGERRHVGREPEHRGRQAHSFDVQVTQLRQADELPQAVLGVRPVQE